MKRLMFYGYAPFNAAHCDALAESVIELCGSSPNSQPLQSKSRKKVRFCKRARMANGDSVATAVWLPEASCACLSGPVRLPAAYLSLSCMPGSPPKGDFYSAVDVGIKLPSASQARS